MSKALFVAVLLAATSSVAYAEDNGSGVVPGAAAGAIGGAVVGGPVGAAVGAVGGAIVGGIASDRRPQFREYVEARHVRSYELRGPVAVGTVLPANGVTLYPVPSEYGATQYEYTVVDGAPVLVDPATRRIVEVVN